MKILVTGVGGQLGHDVMNELARRGHEAVGSDLAETVDTPYAYVSMDLTDDASVQRVIS